MYPEDSVSEGRPSNDAFLPGESPQGAWKIRSKGGGKMTGAASSLARLIEKRYRGGLAKTATEDLLALELRRLQGPHGRIFWRIEQVVGRIADEVDRRAA
jgi:hypothetical protein